MSDGLEKLRSIGIGNINEQTHIAKHYLEDLFSENFETMTKVQFLGFISILQREYNIDLGEFKASSEEFYADEALNVKLPKKVFIATRKRKNYTSIYVGVVIVVFIIAILVKFDLTSNSVEKLKSIPMDNIAIKNAQENIREAISENIEEINTTIVDDDNLTIVSDINISQDDNVSTSFKLLSDSRLWVGYIDLQNAKKYQRFFKDFLELDPKKEWLLLFGNRQVKVELNGEIKKFSSENNIRLLYKNNTVTKLDIQEFKDLNNGKKW